LAANLVLNSHRRIAATQTRAIMTEMRATPIAQFYISAAASLQERRPRILKHNDTFGLFDHNGDVLSGAGSPEGIYHLDTRHLSLSHLLLCGTRPLLLSSTVRDDNAMLRCDLTNADLYEGHDRVLEHDLIHLRRSKFFWRSACFERLAIRNFSADKQHLTLEFEFAADFADIFEVRGAQRERRGILHPPEVGADAVTLAYTGLDNRRRETTLRFTPTPSQLTANRAAFDFVLEPHGRAAVFIEVSCNRTFCTRPAGDEFFRAFRGAIRNLRAACSGAATIETSNEIFNEAIRRSHSDLYMLLTELPEGSYPYAGIPWFSTIFGRDGLIAALQTLWMDPSIARGVLAHLSGNQAMVEDGFTDAEPGKILHEVRRGEMAELGEVPFRRYYGSVDATPLFIMLAGAYLQRTGDINFLQSIWPNIEAALSWIETYGDRDGDGFVEYGRRAPRGLTNQGWKDSHDSVFHADGSLAQGPIALVEVQAYVYAATEAAATIARRLGLNLRASELMRRASDFLVRFDATFWDDELGCYVLALDGAKRPCRVRTSNAGHALYTGIALKERAEPLVRGLMSSDFFSGWGIRTVASTELRYNPMSYHNGSVWPHDNAMIAQGFARYNFAAAAARVFDGLFAASIYIDLRRLPELFCGFPRQRSQGPTFYPVACAPQAWAATVPMSLLQSCLGLSFDPDKRMITLRRPVLPAFLDQVILRGLSIGDARANIRARRSGRETVIDLLSTEGDIGVRLDA
jgi:glycogen debranching enzyme